MFPRSESVSPTTLFYFQLCHFAFLILKTKLFIPFPISDICFVCCKLGWCKSHNLAPFPFKCDLFSLFLQNIFAHLLIIFRSLFFKLNLQVANKHFFQECCFRISSKLYIKSLSHFEFPKDFNVFISLSFLSSSKTLRMMQLWEKIGVHGRHREHLGERSLGKISYRK